MAHAWLPARSPQHSVPIWAPCESAGARTGPARRQTRARGACHRVWPALAHFIVSLEPVAACRQRQVRGRGRAGWRRPAAALHAGGHDAGRPRRQTRLRGALQFAVTTTGAAAAAAAAAHCRRPPARIAGGQRQREQQQRAAMKLLTHNMLQCHIKGVQNGYPLKVEAEKVRRPKRAWPAEPAARGSCPSARLCWPLEGKARRQAAAYGDCLCPELCEPAAAL